MKTRINRSTRQAFYLLLPVMVCILIFSLYPIIRGIYLGFTGYKIGRPIQLNGLYNYIYLIKSGYFLISLKNMFILTIGALLLTYITSIVLSLILNSDIPFRSFWRTIIIIPWAVPPVVKIGIWESIFNLNTGHLNFILKKLGIIGEYIGWYTDPHRAIFSLMVIIAWGCIPFLSLSLLAGLQTIPISNYEAAEIDGASAIGKFRYITLPYLSQVTTVTTSLLFIWIIYDFPSQYLLTKGGPGSSTLTVIVEAYRQGFQFGNFGLASAYGNMMIVLVSIVLYFYITKIFRDGKQGDKSI